MRVDCPKGFLVLAAAACLAIGLAPGCTRLGPDPGYKGPAPVPAAVSHAFARSGPARVAHISLVKETPAFVLRRIRLERDFPGSGSIVADLHETRAGVEKAVIIVLPILGGNNIHANRFAAFFAENGLSGLVVHRERNFKEEFDCERVDEMTQRMVMNIIAAVDWLETRPGRRNTPTGILGISLGGLAASIAIAVEPRIRAGVLMLVGGDLPYILTHSRERRVREKRSALMAARNLDLEGFRNRMARTIFFDPLRFAPYIDARRILLFLAQFDRVVPLSTGRALRRQMGGPETVYLLSGHYTAGLYFSWAKQTSLDFFNKQLAPYQTGPEP